ncbi:hypothetical protein FLA_0715 [Filimonas lacunae]|nr:hypothetical protein FLA_0715 [Filimonas lacunae]
MIREKGGVDADRIKNDPRFERVRENGAEFGKAGKDGKVIRNAFKNVVNKSADNRLPSRLVKDLMQIVKTDTLNARGLRKAASGDLVLLQGFEFNATAPLSVSFTANYSVGFNRTDGFATISVSNFVPTIQLRYPQGATHYKLIGGAAIIDFAAGTFENGFDEGAGRVISDAEASASSLTIPIPPNNTLPLFVVFGVMFYQQVNGTLYHLSNGSYNAFAIVKVDA